MATPISLRHVPTLPPAAPGRPEQGRIDLDALAADLARAVEGEVRFDRGSRALYATPTTASRRSAS
jgi:hypothetical protein